MKKKQLIGWLSLFGIILITLQVKPANAADTYEINRYQTQVDVQKDGSALVKQTMQFAINDDINGIYLNQDLGTNVGKAKQLENPKITINQHQFSPGTGQSGQYQLTKDQQVYRFKLFQPASDGDTLNVVLTYRLTNLIINYQDTAELNWRVIGKGWDTDLNNVTITIQLPSSLKSNQLKSWTHGDLSGHQTVDAQDGQVKITLANNPANQMLESHLIFPTNVTPDNFNQLDQPKKATILATEKRLAESANRKRLIQHNLVLSISVALIAILPIGIGLMRYYIKRQLPKQNYQTNHPEHVYELPDQNGPAVIQYLLNYPQQKALKTASISATILDLVARGNLEINELSNHTRTFLNQKKTNYQLKLISQQKLTSSEQSLIDWLFTLIGQDQVVTLQQIENYPKNNHQTRFNRAYKDWQAAVEQEGQATGWLLAHAHTTVNFVNNCFVASISLFVVSLFAVFFNLLAPWSLISGGLLTAYCFWQRRHLQIWSSWGQQKRYEWLGFKQMLHDITSLDMSAVTDVILWDRYLSFATAFGIAERVIKALNIQFSPEVITTMPLGYFYYSGLGQNMTINQSFNHALDHSFNQAFSTANATSVNGGSGGFSGGSSGGFGGGSGGGTF